MNCGIKKTEAFVSKMQQQYRIAGTRLTSWENCSIYCAAAAFLIGAVSSLILYLNKGSVQNCGQVLFQEDLCWNYFPSNQKAQSSQLPSNFLQPDTIHNFENVLVVRSARDMPDGISEEQPDELVQPEREAARSSAAARARGE